MFGLEERSGAVELYFTTSTTTAQVVVHLEYPTKRCLERWLAADPRHAGRMAKPITPLGTRRKATVPHRELKAIGEADLLVIDELGYLPINIDGAKLLFQIIADSHGKEKHHPPPRISSSAGGATRSATAVIDCIDPPRPHHPIPWQILPKHPLTHEINTTNKTEQQQRKPTADTVQHERRQYPKQLPTPLTPI